MVAERNTEQGKKVPFRLHQFIKEKITTPPQMPKPVPPPEGLIKSNQCSLLQSELFIPAVNRVEEAQLLTLDYIICDEKWQIKSMGYKLRGLTL